MKSPSVWLFLEVCLVAVKNSKDKARIKKVQFIPMCTSQSNYPPWRHSHFCRCRFSIPLSSLYRQEKMYIALKQKYCYSSLLSCYHFENKLTQGKLKLVQHYTSRCWRIINKLILYLENQCILRAGKFYPLAVLGTLRPLDVLVLRKRHKH